MEKSETRRAFPGNQQELGSCGELNNSASRTDDGNRVERGGTGWEIGSTLKQRLRSLPRGAGKGLRPISSGRKREKKGDGKYFSRSMKIGPSSYV